MEDERGAMYHAFFLNLSKIPTSKFWAMKNATPDPIAILIEIKSEKFVETNKVKKTPMKKPMYTIFLATIFPYARFAKSVIKNVIG